MCAEVGDEASESELVKVAELSARLAVGITCHANYDVVDDFLAANNDLHGEGRSSKTESDDDELESSDVELHVKTV